MQKTNIFQRLNKQTPSFSKFRSIYNQQKKTVRLLTRTLYDFSIRTNSSK